jgi:hypothetical protein
MQGSLLLQLLILLVVANGTAVVAKKLLGATLARPLDGGALFGDGQPIFGPSKTIRGIVVSLLATSLDELYRAAPSCWSPTVPYGQQEVGIVHNRQANGLIGGNLEVAPSRKHTAATVMAGLQHV